MGIPPINSDSQNNGEIRMGSREFTQNLACFFIFLSGIFQFAHHDWFMRKIEPVIRRIITGRAPHLEPHLTILYIYMYNAYYNTYTHIYIYMYINKQTINPSYRNLQFFNHISFRSLPRHVRYTHWHLHPAAATLPQ